MRINNYIFSLFSFFFFRHRSILVLMLILLVGKSIQVKDSGTRFSKIQNSITSHHFKETTIHTYIHTHSIFLSNFTS